MLYWRKKTILACGMPLLLGARSAQSHKDDLSLFFIIFYPL